MISKEKVPVLDEAAPLKEQVKQLREYIYELTEELEHLLTHLDAGNLNTGRLHIKGDEKNTIIGDRGTDVHLIGNLYINGEAVR